MHRILTAALGGFMLVFMAMAANAQSNVQLYVGVHGGPSFANSKVSDDTGFFALDGLGSRGWVGGLHGGADLAIPNTIFFVGAFAGYDWQNTEFKATAGTTSFTANLNNSWYTGARAGVKVGAGKVYVLGAYRQTETSWTTAAIKSPDLKGYDVGVGLAYPIAKNIELGIEGIKTHYRSEDLYTATGVDTGANLQTDSLGVMARLTFTFGGGEKNYFSNEDDPPAPKQRSVK